MSKLVCLTNIVVFDSVFSSKSLNIIIMNCRFEFDSIIVVLDNDILSLNFFNYRYLGYRYLSLLFIPVFFFPFLLFFYFFLLFHNYYKFNYCCHR